MQQRARAGFEPGLDSAMIRSSHCTRPPRCPIETFSDMHLTEGRKNEPQTPNKVFALNYLHFHSEHMMEEGEVLM